MIGEELNAKIKEWRIIKTDKETDEIFEIIQGSDFYPTKVIYRKLGIAPEASYALDIPLQIERKTGDTISIKVLEERK